MKFIECLTISNSFSFTHGSFKETGNPLPQIPPIKNVLQLKYQYENFIAGMSTEIAASQNKVDLFESPTMGYGIVSMFVQYSLETGELIHNFSLNGDNLLNKDYRNHLSRVKTIMPEAGINFKLSYRLYF